MKINKTTFIALHLLKTIWKVEFQPEKGKKIFILHSMFEKVEFK